VAEFDFNTQSGQAKIQKIVTDRAKQVQERLHRVTGKPVQIIKNRPLVQTAIELAAKSVDLHKVTPKDDVSDTKRYAHLCFWLIKLTPISYIPKSFMTKVTGGQLIKIPRDYYHFPVNTHIAYLTYLTLHVNSSFMRGEAKAAILRMYATEQSNEVIRSLRFHNYSARSMAMFLESLTSEKLR